MLVGNGLLVGSFFPGSFYLQQHRGYSALHGGLSFLPVVAAIILAPKPRAVLSATSTAVYSPHPR